MGRIFDLKRFGLVFIIIICLALAIYFFLTTVNTPYIGIVISLNKHEQWKVSHVSQDGLAEKWGIREGDKLLFINDELPHKHHTVKSFSEVEQIQSLTLERDENILFYQVEIDWGNSQFFWQAFFPGLFFIVCTILALFIVNQKKTQATWVLVLFVLLLGLSLLSSMASARADLLARVITGLSILGTPQLFLHFNYLFFRQFDIVLFSGRKVLFFYMLNCIVFLIHMMFIFGGSGEVYVYSSYFVFGGFFITLGYGLLVLFWHFFLYQSTVYASLFKVLILGIILSFAPFILLYGLPYLLTGDELFPSTYTVLFFLFLPATLVHLYVSDRLLDVGFILNRIKYYAILGLFPALFVLLLVDLILGTPLGSSESFLLFIAVYLVYILVFYVKEYLDYRLRHMLFPKQNDLHQNLTKLVQRFSQVMKRAELEQTVIQELKQILAVDSLFFFQANKHGDAMEIQDVPLQADFSVLIDSLQKSRHRLIVGETLFLPKGICLVVAEREEQIYLLWIGNKIDKTEWNLDERLQLNALAHYVSVIYENLLLIERLSGKLWPSLHQDGANSPWMKRLLFSIAEKERRNLATDLHDTVLQDQILILRKIEELRSMHLSQLPASMQEGLNWLKEMVLDNMEQIRETCNLLRPPLLQELGLIGALEKLLETLRLRVDFDIDADFSQFTDDLGEEYKLTLYRIIQELLTNASKHSQASHVQLNLISHNGRVSLLYRDDGIGLTTEKLQVARENLGLWGIRERVYSLQGELHIDSEEGKGMNIYIYFPDQTGEGMGKV